MTHRSRAGLRRRCLESLLALLTLSVAGAGANQAATRRSADVPYSRLLEAHLRGARHATPADPASLPHAAGKRALTVGAGQRLDPLVSGDGAIGDRLGVALAVSGPIVLAGIPFDTVVRAGVRGGVSAGTVAVLSLGPGGWVRDRLLTPQAGGNADQFGSAIAFDGTVTVIGAPFASPGDEIVRGAAWVFRRVGGDWIEEAMLEPPAAAAGDRFGTTVSVSGDRIVVGAPRRDPGAVADAGAAFVFDRMAGAWTYSTTLVASDPQANDRFGSAVVLDGDMALIGVPGDEDAPGPADRGSVTQFERDGFGVWTEVAALSPPAAASANAQFGFTLALSADTLAVGAPTDAAGGPPASGSVTLFPRAGATGFGPPQTVFAPAAASGDELGFSLALDGARLLAGAPDALTSEGAACVFTRTAGVWSFEARLSSPNGGDSDIGGFAVAWLAQDALLGAPLADRPPNRAQGQLRLYASASGWTLADAYDTGDGAAGELFGFAVDIDRGTAVAGAHRDDTVGGIDDAGTATVFRRGAVGWQREARLQAADGESEDLFGIAVAVHGDVVVVGAYQDIVGFNINQGSVYVFERLPAGWTQTAHLFAPDGVDDDFLGFSVDFDGTRMIAGAPGEDDAAIDGGAAYVWRRVGGGWAFEEKLLPSGVTAEAFAGIAVALRGDLAVIGAPQADAGDQPLAGRVFAYAHDGAGWQALQDFTAPGVEAFDFFGGAVAIDGSRIAVGMPGDSTDMNLGHGSTWTFARDGAGIAPEQQIVPALPEAGAGLGVALALDSDRLAIGASGTDGAVEDTGVALLYRRGPGGWILDQTLAPADAAEFEFYGRSVALDATDLIVGAPERSRDNPREGAAYIYADDDRLLDDGFE